MNGHKETGREFRHRFLVKSLSGPFDRRARRMAGGMVAVIVTIAFIIQGCRGQQLGLTEFSSPSSGVGFCLVLGSHAFSLPASAVTVSPVSPRIVRSLEPVVVMAGGKAAGQTAGRSPLSHDGTAEVECLHSNNRMNAVAQDAGGLPPLPPASATVKRKNAEVRYGW